MKKLFSILALLLCSLPAFSQCAITPMVLPNGSVGRVYGSGNLATTGCTAPLTWSVTSGSLPTGLALGAGSMPGTEAIVGTPSGSPGTSNFHLGVTDHVGNVATPVAFAITIAAGPPSLSNTTVALAACTVNHPCTDLLTATGGTPPYTWTTQSGTLPGLTAVVTGNRNGSPGFLVGRTNATPGTFTGIVVRVTDNAGAHADSGSLSLVVHADPTIYANYGQACGSNCNLTGSSCSLTSGTLPTYLTLNGNCTITGIPSQAGNFSFVATIDGTPTSETMTVAPALDQYGCLSGAPSPGGASGFFRLEKTNLNKWRMVSPDGNYCYRMAQLNFAEAISTTAYAQKYNSSLTTWAFPNLQEEQALHFNINGIYAQGGYAWPAGTGSGGSAVKVPFDFYFAVGQDNAVNPQSRLGVPTQVKYLEAGASNISWYKERTVDVFDPVWNQEQAPEVTRLNTVGGLSVPFQNAAWIARIGVDETAYFDMLTGFGTVYPNAAFIAATEQFQGLSTSCTTGVCSDKMYTKYAWACGISGVDFGFGTGSSYLQQKYITIAALNAAWGSNYTTFCDAGGFQLGTGTGTGVLDENGIHTWFGGNGSVVNNTSAFTLVGVNANLAADISQFLYLFTVQTLKPQVNAIRTVDTNHIISFGPLGGITEQMRPEVEQGIKDSGIQLAQLAYDSATAQQLDQLQYLKSQGLQPQLTPGASQALFQQFYQATGIPEDTWYGTSANQDSYLEGIGQGGDAQSEADYLTQSSNTSSSRALHYDTDMTTLQSLQANGDYPVMGFSVWSWYDKLSEKTNWGWNDFNDNSYDAVCSITGLATNPITGWPCGGDNGNWGNYWTGGSAGGTQGTNLQLLLNVFNDYSPTGLTITTTTLPSGTKNVPYSFTLLAMGGDNNYTWSVSVGSLPTGLSLNASTGVISGTPSGSGTSNFTIHVHDGEGTPQTANLPTSIYISPGPTATGFGTRGKFSTRGAFSVRP